MAEVNIVVTLGLPQPLTEQIRAVDPDRLAVTVLSAAERSLYRSGHPLRRGYPDSVGAEPVGPEEAGARLAAALARAEVLLTWATLPPDLRRRAPRLKWIQLTTAGADRLLDSELLGSGVTVTTASGIHATPVGEYVAALMLMFAKGWPGLFRSQSQREWARFMPQELWGRTVGIIGLGAIGAEVARLAKAFGMRVVAIRRSVERRDTRHETRDTQIDELLPPAQLRHLLSVSDYVVVAVPLTRETHHLIGERELRTMKPTAVLINVSRGAVIDETALVRALKEGWIAGAGLDVFEQEPLPAESELWDLENVILTPHLAGGTPVYMERAVALFCDNLRRYLAGQPLRNVVDVERGY